MRWVGGFFLIVGLAACDAKDPAVRAERNYATCVHIGVPPQRVRACSELIAAQSATPEQRIEALIVRGNMRAQQEQYMRAIADFGRALRLDPSNIEALLRRAAVHEDRGAYDAAVRDYDAVLSIRPDYDTALRRRQEALNSASSAFQRQIALISDRIARSPRDAALFNERCWMRAINGQELEQALEDCDESLRLRPNAAEVLDSRGLVNYKLARYEAALADYDAALRIDPGGAHDLYGRGASLIAMGREAEGRAALQQALSDNGQVAAMYQSYGVSP